MTKNNFYVLTGAMGGGKSRILENLRKAGVPCVAEPAREILAEQRLMKSDGVPETNPGLFTMLMLSRSIQDYRDRSDSAGPIVFDRGIPDMAAYAALFALDVGPYRRAAELWRYNASVFFFPGWKEIYTTDSERKISFEGARDFGNSVKDVYRELGCRIVEVPLAGVEERTEFILSRL